MSLRFGTDGIRGVANQELTPELCLAIGRAGVTVLGRPHAPFLVGRDTCDLGDMIQAALSAGLASAGVDVIDTGILPTPAVAYLSATRNVAAAMISASHNPFGDNGIKFFQSGGRKLADATEERLEALLDEILHGSKASGGGISGGDVRVTGDAVGRILSDHDGVDAYMSHVVATVSDHSLEGLHFVLDCANGAASAVGPVVFERLGARVSVIHNEPNGVNINADCGSTHMRSLQEETLRLRADAGFAFDGDADRVLASDAAGNLVDGDHIIGMMAIDAAAHGKLTNNTVVLTVMANLGLKLAMKRQGIDVHETAVGDRYVLDALEQFGLSLGGEQSGHVIIPAVASTGDGVLTAVQVASLMRRSGKQLSDLAGFMTKLPQVLRNVRVANRDALDGATAVWNEVRNVEAELGEEGRVLLRPSGTEPLIRVMIEAPTEPQAHAACDRLCAVVERELV